MLRSLIFFISVMLVFISGNSVFAQDAVPKRDPFQKQQIQMTPIKANDDGSLSFNFNNIKVRDMLQLLAQIAEINMVISNSVQSSISLQLNKVSWSQALDTVLLMAGLTKTQQNSVIFITNANELPAGPLSSELISLHYAKAVEIANLLKNQTGLLSKEGAVSADPRSNSLWIQDTSQRLTLLRSYIGHLDRPTKQVLIKARIVNIDDSYMQELGVKFATVATDNSYNGDGLNMDMPVAIDNAGRFNIAIAKLGPNTLLDLELAALESEGHGKIISSPELMTTDRNPAYIESGEEVPYQEKTSSGATSVAFKKAVLSLKVIPEVTAENKIILNLTVNQDKLSAVLVNGVPAIQTREVQTQVVVQAGQTLVLGGIYEQTNNQAVERIPFLGSIPVLGNLFRDKVVKNERKELLIFVTPIIVE